MHTEYRSLLHPPQHACTLKVLRVLFFYLPSLTIYTHPTQDLIEFVQLRSVTLYIAVSSNESDSFPGIIVRSSFPVENCVCPEGYSGQFCQECARSFVRASANPADPCTACKCNGLAFDCEPTTGICFNCMGNSEGETCERCQPGFFGDPTRGIPCLPCECPTLDRSFSPTCYLDVTTNVSVCNNCDPGYTGQQCEICMDGFYGNPFVSF